jgi:hypothetical protein
MNNRELFEHAVLEIMKARLPGLKDEGGPGFFGLFDPDRPPRSPGEITPETDRIYFIDECALLARAYLDFVISKREEWGEDPSLGR